MKKLVTTAILAACMAALVAGVASAAELQRFEAESMSFGAFAAVGADSINAPSGGAALRYDANGTATKPLSTAGPADTVKVVGHINGTATSRVCVRPTVDGTPVSVPQCYDPGQTSYAAKTFAGLTVPAGATLGVEGSEIASPDKLFVDYVTVEGTPPRERCTGDVVINPGEDLDAKVNADPATVSHTFCVHADDGGTTYPISADLEIQNGDRLIGDPGKVVTKGNATYGVPLVKITDGSNDLSRLATFYGSNTEMRWIDLSGATGEYTGQTQADCDNWGEFSNRCPKAGSGVAMGMGQADGTALLRYVSVHDNESVGISSINGKLLNSNIYRNGTNPDFWGYEAAAMKGVDEYEVANSYVHDNAANGVWCDQGCKNVPSMVNGFWVHDNLIVDNGRWGVRYEYSPMLGDNQTQSAVTALVENNQVHGNGTQENHSAGGISMEDAQDGVFRANRFGPATVGGTNYQANEGLRAILFAWGRTKPRTDLDDASATDNVLNGERIDGCGTTDTDSTPGGVLVTCQNNTP